MWTTIRETARRCAPRTLLQSIGAMFGLLQALAGVLLMAFGPFQPNEPAGVSSVTAGITMIVVGAITTASGYGASASFDREARRQAA